MSTLLTGDGENYFFPSLTFTVWYVISIRRSVSACLGASLHCPIDRGCWGIFKAELEQSATLINIGRAENTGECGETVATPCTRSWGGGGGGQRSAGLKMKHECATVCCRPPLNRITYCASYSLHRDLIKKDMWVFSFTNGVLTNSSRNGGSLFTISTNMQNVFDYLFRDRKSRREQ